MSSSSHIEWTDASWNPVTGCSWASPGCDHCYARAMARRLRAAGVARYAFGFEVREHEDLLGEPEHWRRPRRVFVCSMSDLFHPQVRDAFIEKVFERMRALPRHRFQVLTKRPACMAHVASAYLAPWPENVWAGTTIESDEYVGRADELRRIPAAVRFISCEPLLGPLDHLDLTGIGWVIVGGETGPRARLMHRAWVRDLRDRCVAGGIPFFFKRWGGPGPGTGSRYLDDRIWQQFPDGSAAGERTKVAVCGDRVTGIPLSAPGSAREPERVVKHRGQSDGLTKPQEEGSRT